MRHVLIATHGRIASGFKSALKLFLNSADDIATIDAYVGDASENYEDDLHEFFKEIREGDEAYIFTDIKAGSVNQRVMAALSEREYPVTLVTNVNLPLLVGLLIGEGVKTPEEIQAMIQETKAEVVSLKELMDKQTDQSDNDFWG